MILNDVGIQRQQERDAHDMQQSIERSLRGINSRKPLDYVIVDKVTFSSNKTETLRVSW